MRSRMIKRTPSGRVIHPQGKKDGRTYQPMKVGTRLTQGLRVVAKAGDRYMTDGVSKVLFDNAGRSYKNLKVITKGSIVLLTSGSQARVIKRSKDNLICQINSIIPSSP